MSPRASGVEPSDWSVYNSTESIYRFQQYDETQQYLTV
jgi:hypothetical protein